MDAGGQISELVRRLVIAADFVEERCSYSYTRRNKTLHGKQKTSEGARQFMKHSG